MTKSDEEKKIKRISVAMTEETYEGVKALAAVTGTTLNDYVFNLLTGEVKKNATVIQQLLLTKRAYEESVRALHEGTKKDAEKPAILF